MADEPALTMAVREANGEVSASVEETNRVRAALGLKPLATGGESQIDVESRRLAEQRQREQDQEEMRAKLDDARRQRLLHAKLGGKSIGEQLEGEEMDSAAAWIAKSRRQEEERKVAKAERRSRPKPKPKPTSSLNARYDEYDEESQIAGALVAHRTEDFKEGEEVVLTLADAPIMETKEGNYVLHDGEETLENVNMTEDWRRQRAREMGRGVRERDDPFASSGVLDKYDEAPERATIRLDASGRVDEARLKKLAAVKQRLAMQAATGGAVTAHDLSETGASIAVPSLQAGSDYMSVVEAEAAGFKKPANKAKKKLRKKTRSLDDTGLDLDAMAAAEAAAGSDLGSRAAREQRMAERAATAEAEREDRAQRFERALDIAETRAAQRLRDQPIEASNGGDADMSDVAKCADASGYSVTNGGRGAGSTTCSTGIGDALQGVAPMDQDRVAASAEPEEESAEVDPELYAALARARRLRQVSRGGAPADSAAMRVSEQLAAAERWATEQRVAQGITTANGTAPPDGSIEFSETGEFVKAVQVKDEEDTDLPSVLLRRAKEQGVKRPGMDTEGNLTQSEARVREEKVKVKVETDGAGASSSRGGWGGAADEGSGEEDQSEDDVAEDEQLAALHDRPAAQGLGAALQMARTRGMLAEEKESAGRMFDMKGAGLHQYEQDDDEDGVKLNYFDEYGRKMTQKEAFRQLSWNFHGKGPSKKRREKRMAVVEAQMQQQKEDYAMKYMGALQRAQQATKSAHVFLSGAHAIKAAEVTAKQPRPAKEKESSKKKAKLV